MYDLIYLHYCILRLFCDVRQFFHISSDQLDHAILPACLLVYLLLVLMSTPHVFLLFSSPHFSSLLFSSLFFSSLLFSSLFFFLLSSFLYLNFPLPSSPLVFKWSVMHPNIISILGERLHNPDLPTQSSRDRSNIPRSPNTQESPARTAEVRTRSKP